MISHNNQIEKNEFNRNLFMVKLKVWANRHMNCLTSFVRFITLTILILTIFFEPKLKHFKLVLLMNLIM